MARLKIVSQKIVGPNWKTRFVSSVIHTKWRYLAKCLKWNSTQLQGVSFEPDMFSQDVI